VVDGVKGLGLASLANLFGNPEDKAQDSEKLMDLYWNRAELKKSFARAQKEHFRLQDRIKQQEGATARIQQKLDHVEELLIDPETAFSAVVYYQLRGLALSCEGKLASFAEKLKQQREKQKNKDLMSGWKSKLAQECSPIEQKILKHRNDLKKLDSDLLVQKQLLESMSLIKKLFKGRSVKSEIKNLQQKTKAIRAEEQSLLGDISEINKRSPPDIQGLDIADKRSINLLILSFAQQLYLHFADHEFAVNVKQASDKSAGAINYGNQHDCMRLFEQIQNHGKLMEQSPDFGGAIQKGAKLIAEKASYSSDNDPVPAAESTTTVFEFDKNGSVNGKLVGILSENYWGISQVLSR